MSDVETVVVFVFQTKIVDPELEVTNDRCVFRATDDEADTVPTGNRYVGGEQFFRIGYRHRLRDLIRTPRKDWKV